MIETILISGLKYELRGITIEMGVYPVTQAQYKEVMGRNPSFFRNDNNPVESVSWEDAVEFCKRLSDMTGKTYRLPTEEEWEFACRAGTTTDFYFGDELSPELANYDGHYRGTTPVGKFPPNAFGLYDMHGNVWEWCQGNRGRKPIRGGSWFNNPRNCRSACRYYDAPNDRDYGIGFRVVLEATEVS